MKPIQSHPSALKSHWQDTSKGSQSSPSRPQHSLEASTLPKAEHGPIRSTSSDDPLPPVTRKPFGSVKARAKSNQNMTEGSYNEPTRNKNQPTGASFKSDHVRGSMHQNQKPTGHRQGKSSFKRSENIKNDKDKLFTQPFVPPQHYNVSSQQRVMHRQGYPHPPPHHLPTHPQQALPLPYTQAYSPGSVNAVPFYVTPSDQSSSPMYPPHAAPSMTMNPGWPVHAYYAATNQPIYDRAPVAYTYISYQSSPPTSTAASPAGATVFAAPASSIHPASPAHYRRGSSSPPVPTSSLPLLSTSPLIPALSPRSIPLTTATSPSITASNATRSTPVLTTQAAPSKAITIINPDTMAPVHLDISKSASTSSRTSTSKAQSTADLITPSSYPPSLDTPPQLTAYTEIMDPAIREREEREAQEQMEELRQQQTIAEPTDPNQGSQQPLTNTASDATVLPEACIDLPVVSATEPPESVTPSLSPDALLSPVPTETSAVPALPVVAEPDVPSPTELNGSPSTGDHRPADSECKSTMLDLNEPAPPKPSPSPPSPVPPQAQAQAKNVNEVHATDQPLIEHSDALAATVVDTMIQAPSTGDGLNGVIRYDPVFLMQFMPLCLDYDRDLTPFQNMRPLTKLQPSAEHRPGRSTDTASSTSALPSATSAHAPFSASSQRFHHGPSQLSASSYQGNHASSTNNYNRPAASGSSPTNTYSKFNSSHPRGAVTGHARPPASGASHDVQRDGSMGRHGAHKPAATNIRRPAHAPPTSSLPSSMTGASAPNTSTYNMLTDVIAAVTSNPMHYQQASYYKPRAPSNDPLLRPLPKSENRWVPPSVASQSPSPPPTSFTKSSHQQDPAAASQGPPVLASSSSTTKADPSTATLTQDDITRKVKGLLNKLTLEKFDTISDKIILYAEQSRTEDNGQSLRTVMKLVFEKACDEPAFAAMWAQLCRKLFEWMPNDIKDVSVLDKNGQPTSGVNLFYKYLLYRCQNGFEQGWSVSLPQTDGPVLSDEYYAAVKVKRQGLGLVQFIGELYRRGLLTTGIIYKCLKHLCDSGSQVREEEVESLCKLLTTVGADLDRNPQTAPFTDVFLKRMKTEMYNSPHLSSRVQFMMQDVFDLRDNNWVPRRGKQDGPKTIAEIHELAEKEKEEAARRVGQGRGVPLGRQTSQQNMAYRNGSTGTSGPGKNGKRPARSNVDRGVSGADGWSTVSAGQGYGSRRVNDLSNFGKSDRYQQRNNVLGPTNSPFAALHRTSGKHLDAKSHSTQETTNKFSALDDHDENQERPTIRPQARDTSETKQSLDDDRAGAEDDTKATQLDPTALKRRIDNTLQEFYSMNSVKDLMEDIQELKKSDMEPLLASALLNVVEKKLAQVESVCQLIPQLYDQQVLSKQVLTVAFQGFMELYEDLAIDVPQAPLYVAKLLLAANLTLEDVWTDNALGPLPSSLKDAYTNLKA